MAPSPLIRHPNPNMRAPTAYLPQQENLQMVQDDMGSYGNDNHGCFKASEAEGRFFGFISSR